MELTRRKVLGVGSGVLLALAARLEGANDFWNKKASENWSAGEIDQLKSKSPWAKKVRAEVAGGRAGAMNGSGPSGTIGGIAGADSNGLGGGSGRSRKTSGADPNNAGEAGSGGASQGPEIVVRWETAKPVMDATKIELPAAFEDHYAVSVTGLPPQLIMAGLRGAGRGGAEAADPEARQKAAIEHLLAATTLTVKGGKPEPSDLLVQSRDKASLIFAFPKAALPIKPTDREVSFDMDLGLARVKAKFDPKEMTYKGDLAV